jgi:hypothetical protein
MILEKKECFDAVNAELTESICRLIHFIHKKKYEINKSI